MPAQWVQASITPDAPHLIAGDNPASDWPLAMATSVVAAEGSA
jgi:hypothetical protein